MPRGTGAEREIASSQPGLVIEQFRLDEPVSGYTRIPPSTSLLSLLYGELGHQRDRLRALFLLAGSPARLASCKDLRDGAPGWFHVPVSVSRVHIYGGSALVSWSQLPSASIDIAPAIILIFAELLS